MVIEVGDKVLRTACPSHDGNACGILAHVRDGKVVKLEPGGFPEPHIQRICLKMMTMPSMVYHPDRLKYPLRRVGARGEGKWERLSWDEAIDYIAARLTAISQKYGSRSVGWVLGGPGSGTVKFAAYTRFASLSQGTRVSCWGYGDSAGPCAATATFGAHYARDFLTGFPEPKLNVVWGTNPGEAGPFRMRSLFDDKERGVKLVVVDPIFTVTASKADEYLGIRPGTDAALALGMMNVIFEKGLHDEDFIRRYSVGPFLVRLDNKLFLREKDLVPGGSASYLVWDLVAKQPRKAEAPGAPAALSGRYEVRGIQCATAFQLLQDLAAQYPPERAAEITEIPAEQIRRFALAYAQSKPAAIHTNNGLGRHYHGDLTFRAVCTLGTVTGNIVLPGSMHRRAFILNWGPFLHPNPSAPTYSRLGILNLYDAVIQGKPFPIKAAWFAFINFVNQCVNSNKIIHQVIPGLEFIVATDMFMTSSAQLADVVLPITSYLEHSDLVHGPQPYLQLQQKVIDPLYESKSDVDIVTLLAKKMGYGAYFDKTEEEFIDLILASGHPSVEGITVASLRQGPAKAKETPPLPSDQVKFRTPSGKIEFYVERLREFGEELPVYKEPLESARTPLAKKYPLVFVQVHSRFRTHSMFANSPGLLELNPEPVVEMNPADAKKRGIADGDMVVVFNDRGKAKLRAKLNEGTRPGVVNIMQGWWFCQFAEGGFNCLTHDAVNPAQDAIYEPNMAMNDVLVEVKKAEEN